MPRSKFISWFVVILLALAAQSGSGQSLNISGDTIYVNAEAESTVYFPVRPQSFSTMPINAPYSLKGVGTGVNISAKAEHTAPVPLKVSEGGRNHIFIICFKKNLDYNSELLYDYGDMDKLARHVSESRQLKQARSNETVLSVIPAGLVEKSALSEKDADAVEDRYHALTEQARAGLQQKKYPEAKSLYNKALLLKPGDLYALHQIELIDKAVVTAKTENTKLQAGSPVESYRLQGDKAFSANRFSEARMAYEQLLNIAPADAAAKNRLKMIIQKQLAQQKSDSMENDYRLAIQLADQLYGAGDYEGASLNYSKAMQSFMRPYPQQQLKKLSKDIAEQASREKRLSREQADQRMLEDETKKKQALADNYKAQMDSADHFFERQQYAAARMAYNKALDFLDKEQPRQRIAQIDKLVNEALQQKSVDQQKMLQAQTVARYDSVMRGADKLFAMKEYAAAKTAYNQALTILPGPGPREQIRKINELAVKEQANEKAEKQRQEVERALTVRFNSIVKSADSAIGMKNFLKAKMLYSAASKIKPNEHYPSEKLLMMDSLAAGLETTRKARTDSIERQSEIVKQYQQALASGKLKLQKNELLNAKIFYEQAVQLRPAGEEARAPLELINKKLSEISRQKILDSTYEDLIGDADSLLTGKMFGAAMEAYTAASKIKPAETYPKSQTRYLQSELLSLEKQKLVNEKKELEIIYKDASTSAEKAVADKRYRDARCAYTTMLLIHPDNEYAVKRLDIVNNQLQLTRQAIRSKIAVPEAVAINPKKRNRKGKKQERAAAAPVLRPMDTTDLAANLSSKYPGINLGAFAPEQSFTRSLLFKDEEPGVYDTIRAQPVSVNLTSSTDQPVRMLCEGIYFRGNKVYIRVKLQNFSDHDFLAGAMMLGWTKKAGNFIKLSPVFLYPAPPPVITPAREAEILYVARSYDIDDDDALSLELMDRLNKTKLRIDITGRLYNREWAK